MSRFLPSYRRIDWLLKYYFRASPNKEGGEAATRALSPEPNEGKAKSTSLQMSFHVNQQLVPPGDSSQQRLQGKAKRTNHLHDWSFHVNQQLPILPGRFQPSTFGVCELNYRVRHGYGCILTAIATESLRVSVLSKLYRRKVFRRALATWSRL